MACIAALFSLHYDIDSNPQSMTEANKRHNALTYACASTRSFDSINVTGSGKTGLIATITDIHFLPVRESCTHALPRNTKYLIIDGQVCFYRRLFTDAVKSPGCISLPWRALIGLHGVPGCSSRQSWPPLWILPVCVPY